MGFSPSLLFYELREKFRARGGARTGAPNRPDHRPAGQLAWFHIDRLQDWPAVIELMNSLSDDLPDTSFLLTTEGAAPDDLPDGCTHEHLPPDLRGTMSEFMSFWKPDISVWFPQFLRPVAVQTCADLNVPLVMIDTGGVFEISQAWPFSPLLKRGLLRKFQKILSGDEATTIAIISAGARRSSVETTGTLQLDSPALPCNHAEWETMIELLAGRPLWLAACIDMAELRSVVAAHRQVLRKSHRLLLIIVPGNLDESDEFARILNDMGIRFARRSLDEDLEIDVQIYLADDEGEMGLWYRLAPITFMGRTLVGSTDASPNPFDAAALGSVVLHGPLVDAHSVKYQRLARAGASREIAQMGELGHALDGLLAPDRAAIMAHAAWQISSAGAEVMKTAREALIEVLETQKAQRK